MTTENDNSILETGDLSQVEEKYAKFDRILCSLGSQVNDLTKFSVIENVISTFNRKGCSNRRIYSKKFF